MSYPASEVKSSFPGRKFEELMKLIPQNKYINSLAFAGNWASQVAQAVKNLPTMHKIQVQPLSLEDPLEKGMATHSSVLAWKIPETEQPGGL